MRRTNVRKSHKELENRMAMAFSLAACGTEPVTILDPGCVAKTFPTYFEVLDSLSQRRNENIIDRSVHG